MEGLVMNQLLELFRNKKVFLTGHTGFKGSWLLQLLNLLGAQVKGYALLPESLTDMYYAIQGDKLCESVIGDIRDKERVISEITSFQPDFVFHLAAQPLVRLSYQLPTDTFETNANGTAYILEALRFFSRPCYCVCVTTDKVYENNEWYYPYRENDRLGGYDPYSASKACAELIISSYRNSFFNVADFEKHKKAIAVARAGNVIGGGDWSADRLVPDIVRALQGKKAIQIRSPRSVRPWQHVLEPLIGYLSLAAQLSMQPQLFSQAYNFGPYYTDVLTVEELVQRMIANWGTGTYEIVSDANELHEAHLLMLDISKAISELKWKPKFSVADSINFTTEWYKHLSNAPDSIQQKTVSQINFFLNHHNAK